MLRVGLPIGGVGLIIGFLLGIAIYADNANRAGVLGLSSSLLQSIQERIALQVSAYLEPAAHATLLAHSMLGRGGATDHAEQAYQFAASVLQETPQIANVLFADAAGNFMLVTRATGAPDGSTQTKRILMSSDQTRAGQTVEWITRDGSGRIMARRTDPNDDYDARTRSWFKGARAAQDVFWTGVYVFFSERAPGITAAVHGPEGDPDVVGVDIRLDVVSSFLSKLSIGRTGRAYIVTKDGELVAGPDPKQTVRTKDGQLAPAQVDEIDDADAAATWDHFRVQGPGNRVIEAGGRRLISIVTPLKNNGEDWHLLITVPEDEFSGFVAANSRHAALLSLVVVAIAAGLAVLLVIQGLRADRADRAIAHRSEVVRRQSAAFARLTTEVGIFDSTGAPPPVFTETVAEATGARRVGIWRLRAGAQVLRCEDSFEAASGGHLAGLELSRQEVPALFEALAQGTEIDVPDARRDHRTAALHVSLMVEFGSTALFAVPIMQRGRAAGMVMLEDARSDQAVQDFARACAALVALHTPIDDPSVTLTVSGAAPAFMARAAGPIPDPAPDERGLDASLAVSVPNRFEIAIRNGKRAAILVLRLPDVTMVHADRMERDGARVQLAHRVACAVQMITADHAVPYVKMLGTMIVAAAGYSMVDGDTGDPGAAEARGESVAAATQILADTAIALRERCATLFNAEDEPGAFGLGLDVGLILGGALGEPPGLFNLWGEALRGAEWLAESAPAGGIQASEQAYELLRQSFLFRPRGLFYRPAIGDTRSYILAGRV